MLKKIFLTLLVVGLNFSIYGIELTEQEQLILKFLSNNRTEATSMPKSFYVPEDYWQKLPNNGDEEALNERVLATYGLNIYDGAVWQIAQSILGNSKAADEETQRLLSGKSGEISLRASSKDFRYGDLKARMGDDHAFFFRMISDQWELSDPLTGESLTWMDWKPVLGENAWATLIGPLQVAAEKYGVVSIPLDSDEVKLALSLLPTLKLMQSPIGGIYYAPWGTHDRNPQDISIENNISLYAGLKMLKQVLESQDDPDMIVENHIDPLIQGIENFIKEYGYDAEKGYLAQGGLYNDPANPKSFTPSPVFAVDVQTWGVAAISPEKIDEWFGPNTAYEIWQNTKKIGGYYDDEGLLRGVGYTTNDEDPVLSGEWTLGAILMVQKLSEYYHYPDLDQDLVHMREGIDTLKKTFEMNGEEVVAFDYANKRYEIPFGWYANDIPSLASTAWVVMIDRYFNPFILGGDNHYIKAKRELQNSI